MAIAKTDRLGWLLYDSANNSFSVMVEPSQQAEIFGFYGISGKFSSAVGPLVFGAVSHLSGSQRLAMLAVGLLFIIGLVLLMRVEEPSPRRMAWS